jgi:outer membrane protein TolC
VVAYGLAPLLFGQATGPVRITLDEAIQMALQHNHNMLAMMTTIQQAQAEETTANLRPNPSLFADWEYLPLGSPAHQNPSLYQGQSTGDYLHNNTEGDIGLSYRSSAAGKDSTACKLPGTLPRRPDRWSTTMGGLSRIAWLRFS